MPDIKDFEMLHDIATSETGHEKEAAGVGSALGKGKKVLWRVAEGGAEPVAKLWEAGVKASPAVALTAIGVKGYQKGKEKLRRHQLMKRIREARKQQAKYGSLWSSLKGIPGVASKAIEAVPPETKRLMLTAAAIPAIGGAGGIMLEGVRRLYYAARKSMDFNRMMEANPSLKDRNPKQLRMTFNAIHRLNPQFASEPIVAGTVVRRAMDAATMEGSPAIDPSTATLLAKGYGGGVSPTQTAEHALRLGLGGAAAQTGREIARAPEDGSGAEKGLPGQRFAAIPVYRMHE